MPYQKNHGDMSMTAARLPVRVQAPMQASGCGCGAAAFQAPTQGCTLAAPAPFQPACTPAAFHAGVGAVCGKYGCYQRMATGYGQ